MRRISWLWLVAASVWRDLFKRGRLHRFDRAVLKRFEATASDPLQPRRVEYHLHFGTEEDARAAADELRGLGELVKIDPPADLSEPSLPWTVVAADELVINADSLRSARQRLEVLASAHGGEYDALFEPPKPLAGSVKTLVSEEELLAPLDDRWEAEL